MHHEDWRIITKVHECFLKYFVNSQAQPNFSYKAILIKSAIRLEYDRWRFKLATLVFERTKRRITIIFRKILRKITISHENSRASFKHSWIVSGELP